MTDQDVPESMVPPGFSSGSRIAGYLLEEQVGVGGMAVVFRAYDERLNRTVALKILAPALAADDAFRQRFIRESRAAAAVDDPHIIPVFEAGEADSVLFIAMRFVRGGDVRELVARHGRLPAGRAVDIIAQAASALDAAHSRGLVHRDVKPANMLLESGADIDGRSDHVYLSDFGLSKASMHTTGLTGTGMFLGTLHYISPEQIEGRPVDGRADQYSLACAAFELLSGVPPFQRDDPMAMMYAQIHAAPPQLTALRPDLPAAADEVFARALAKSPGDRYESCRHFSGALRRALGVAAAASGPGACAGATGPGATTEATGPALRVIGGPPTQTHAQAHAQAQADRPDYATAGAARRNGPWALLIAASILAAAGIVAGAILVWAKEHAVAAPSSSAPPRSAGAAGGPASSPQPHSGPSSPGSGAQGRPESQASASASYRLVAPLYPGASTVSISSVAWSPVSSLVAIGDKNGSTYLWNPATAVRAGHALPGPSDAYTTAFSPDGTILATGYRDGTTSLWNVATGRLLSRLNDPGSSTSREVDSVAFSPDGRTLATSDGNGYINLWSVRNAGQDVTRRTSLADPAGAGVYSVAFSGQGTLATGDYAGHVYLWDAASGTVTATFSFPGGPCPGPTICHAVSALAFSSDGSVLAAATESGNAELWSVRGQRGRPIAQPVNSAFPQIWGLSFDGTSTLAVADDDGHFYLWQVDPVSLAATAAGSRPDPSFGPQGIGALAFSADGQYLVTGDTNGSAYLWKVGGQGVRQSWKSSRLTITPHSLGAVTIGMTIPQASAAAGEKLVPVGDGVLYPGGNTGSGLSVVEGGSGGTVSCVSASDRTDVPAVVTPQGFPLGGTLTQLKAVYKSRLHFVPAPAGGISPVPGYVVRSAEGNLVFWVRNGKTVDEIAGGPMVLPSTDCI